MVGLGIELQRREGGYGQVLLVAFPAIISMLSVTVMRVMDRMFLGWYSAESFAASMPAGIWSFTIISLFLGTAGYVSTFVAQYYGVGRPERIGSSLWQGIYFACASAVIIGLFYPFAETIFQIVGHEPAVGRLEAQYFKILMLGGGLPVLSTVLSAFYTGRGKTFVPMPVNVVGNGLNIFLNYCMIFGHLGFPEWGIKGAAVATVISQGVIAATLFFLVLLPSNRRVYSTGSSWRFDSNLFKRLLHYGSPAGLGFVIDMFAFSLVISIIGRLGTVSLMAASAGFTVNMMGFMPMVGIGMAVTVLVGRFLGQNRVEVAKRAVRSGMRIAFAYVLVIVALYILVPRHLLSLFTLRAQEPPPEEFFEKGRMMFHFLIFYCITDAIFIIYSSALKGAGDTRFVMIMIAVLSFAAMVLPAYVSVEVFELGIGYPFFFLGLYGACGALVFYLRYRGGKWESMRVIEPVVPLLTPPAPDVASEGPLAEG